jgi:predicted phage terminase large subunit-like protein
LLSLPRLVELDAVLFGDDFAANSLPDPQPGPQETFLSSTADVVIYGGAAGSGKTWALLRQPLDHIENSEFSGVIFRRTSPQIRNPGGLWDESVTLYSPLNAEPKQTVLEWAFPSGAKLKFAHLQYDLDVHDWQGAQVPFIGFDQLEHFSASQFWYMFSRNRSTCGVHPYIRATVNPDADSWVAELIAWWIDQETGFPIESRSGVVRWFIRRNNELVWADSKEELTCDSPDEEPKSLTFIPAKLSDNQILMQKDPGYLANLRALSFVDRERLLGGNWKIVATAGKIFNRAWFEIVDAVPAGGEEVRFWDLAATEKKMLAKTNKTTDPDFTAGCKIKMAYGVYYVLDAQAAQIGPPDADNLIKNTASQDKRECKVRWEIEGGASGVRDSLHLVQLLAGYDCAGVRPEGDKIVRAKGLAAQALAGNVKLLRGDWNTRWLNHMHGQPELPHDDEMDAASGAFNELTDLHGVVEDLDMDTALDIDDYRGRG